MLVDDINRMLMEQCFDDRVVSIDHENNISKVHMVNGTIIPIHWSGDIPLDAFSFTREITDYLMYSWIKPPLNLTGSKRTPCFESDLFILGF